MSEWFEGVVCRCSAGRLEDAIRDASAAGAARGRRPLTKVRAATPELAVAYAANRRDEGSFADQMASLAEELSRPLGRALLVIYDTRAGVRLSVLFADGEVAAEYDTEDELFVPLDDEGEPQLKGPRLTLAELDADEEYETVVNAVQRGLEDLGAPELWPRLRELISSQ